MNAQTASNSQSSLFTSLTRAAGVNPYVYTLGPQMVNASRETLKVSPNGSQPSTNAAQTVTFDLPRLGFWNCENSYIKLTCKVSGGISLDDASSWLALNAVNEVSLLARGQVIESSYTEGMIYDIISEPVFNKRANLEKAVRKDRQAALAAASAIVMYIPLRTLSSKGSMNMMDLRFMEPVKLQIKLASLTTLIFATTVVYGDGAGDGCYLYADYNVLEEAEYNKYTSENYPADKPLIKLSHNWYLDNEKQYATENGIVVTKNYDIGCKSVIEKSIIALWDNAKRPTAATDTSDHGVFKPLTKVVVYASGKRIFDSDDMLGYSIINNEHEMGLTVSTANILTLTDNSPNNLFVINWGQIGLPAEFKGEKGCLSLAGLSSVYVELTFTPNVTGFYNCRVSHKHLQTLSIDPRNGSVSVSSRN